MSDTKILLPESELPRSWYNVLADARAPPPPLHPGTGQPIGPDDLAPLFPIDLILQEVSTERELRSPTKCWTSAAVAADAALPGRPARARAGHRLAHLLQVRGGVAGRLAQAEYGRRPGLLQRPRRAHPAGHRDRCRPVGQRAGVRLPGIRARMQGLHGQHLLRAEALPAGDDGDLGRRGGAQPAQDTAAGRAIRERDPDSLGSLGIAISEAVEDAASRDDTSTRWARC